MSSVTTVISPFGYTVPGGGGGSAPTVELDASDALRFQWTDTGAPLYLVRGRATGGGSFTDLGSTPIALFPYIGLSASTSYDFQYCEADLAGNATGSWSSTGTGTTLTAGYPTISEFPRTWIDDSSLPSGSSVSVNSIATLQTAINDAAAAGSGYILVDKTATYEGVITLPTVAAGTGEIFICSSDWGSLPARSHAYGSWVTPAADSSKMPFLKVNTNNSPLMYASGDNADRYRFIGIEFGIKAGVNPFSQALIELAGPSTTNSLKPYDIRFDRCIIHNAVNTTTAGHIHGMLVEGGKLAVRQCYFTDAPNLTGSEIKNITILEHAGPVKFVANYTAAQTINFLTGGSTVDAANTPVVTDIEVRNSLFFRPTEYLGAANGTKNLFEFKTALRALVTGCVFENHWRGGQEHAITFTPRPGDSGNNAVVRHITFHANRLKNVNSGFSLASVDSGTTKSGSPYTLSHCVVDATGISQVTGLHDDRAMVGMIFHGLDDVIMTHITGICRNDGSFRGWEWIPYNQAGPDLKCQRFRRINSIFYDGGPSGYYEVDRGDLSNNGPTIVNTHTVFKEEKNNSYIDHSSADPYSGTGHIYPSGIAAAKFVDYTNHDLRLANDSPMKNAASDGTDMGCDFTKLNGS